MEELESLRDVSTKRLKQKVASSGIRGLGFYPWHGDHQDPGVEQDAPPSHSQLPLAPPGPRLLLVLQKPNTAPLASNLILVTFGFS